MPRWRHAHNRITSIRRENGNMIYYGYDAVDRLTSEDWYDAGMAPLYGFQWGYDPVGNRTYENRDGTETYYTYDAGNSACVPAAREAQTSREGAARVP